MATNNKRGPEPGTLHIDKRAKRLLDDPISDGPDDELLTTRQVAEWFECLEAWVEIARTKTLRGDLTANDQVPPRRSKGVAAQERANEHGSVQAQE